MNKNKVKCSSQISHCGPVGKKPIAMAQVPANVSVFFVFWFFSQWIYPFIVVQWSSQSNCIGFPSLTTCAFKIKFVRLLALYTIVYSANRDILNFFPIQVILIFLTVFGRIFSMVLDRSAESWASCLATHHRGDAATL